VSITIGKGLGGKIEDKWFLDFRLISKTSRKAGNSCVYWKIIDGDAKKYYTKSINLKK
jgi:hypothetical protein